MVHPSNLRLQRSKKLMKHAWITIRQCPFARVFDAPFDALYTVKIFAILLFISVGCLLCMRHVINLKNSSDLYQSLVEKFLPFVELGSPFKRPRNQHYLVKFGVSPILHIYLCGWDSRAKITDHRESTWVTSTTYFGCLSCF